MGETLESFRNRLRTGALRPPKKRLDHEKMRKGRAANARWVISDRGDDAKLNFGKHKGQTISDLAKADPSYLVWMWKEGGFDEELREVIELHIPDVLKERYR